MPWPLSQDYNEAIQSPATSLGDPELQGGQPVMGPLGMPMPRSGNFADVYEFVGASGAKWAVKCFTRAVPGLRERYTEISKHLIQAKLPFTVDFEFLARGIRIRGDWYPVLKMQWVEGFLLNEFVRHNLNKPALLEGLGQIWLRMAKCLRDVNMAHADLQHGNVILAAKRNKTGALPVKLIDYDGMWVPALANKKSGEAGHPNYQHPQRLQDGTYTSEVDRLPLLVIACALRCLVVGGSSLWDRYDNGDNLLFREGDLKAPGSSPLFKELRDLPDPQARMLVEELHKALAGTFEEVPFIDRLLQETTPASVPVPASPSPTVKPVEPAAARLPWDFDHASAFTAGPSSVPVPTGLSTAVMPVETTVAAIASMQAMLVERPIAAVVATPAQPTAPPAIAQSPWEFNKVNAPEPAAAAPVQRRGIPLWALAAGGGVAATAVVVLVVFILLLVIFWPKGDFALKVEAQQVSVPQGGKVKFKISAERKGFNGPIVVQLRNLPAGVMARETQILADKNSAMLEISATATASPGKISNVSAVGTAGNVKNSPVVTSFFTVEVEPIFTIAVEPAQVALAQGGNFKLKIRAIRKSYEGPIEVELRDLPAQVNGGKATLVRGASEIEIELTTAMTASVGDHKGTVMATAVAANKQTVHSPPFVLSVTAAEPPLIGKNNGRIPPGKGPVLLSQRGRLMPNDPIRENKPHKPFTVQLVKGKTYVIDLQSNEMDSYLYLYDPNGFRVAEDDDNGGGFTGLDSRIHYTPNQTGNFVVAASVFSGLNGGGANFNLTVRER